MFVDNHRGAQGAKEPGAKEPRSQEPRSQEPGVILDALGTFN
jgi:hypothetical protein